MLDQLTPSPSLGISLHFAPIQRTVQIVIYSDIRTGVAVCVFDNQSQRVVVTFDGGAYSSRPGCLSGELPKEEIGPPAGTE